MARPRCVVPGAVYVITRRTLAGFDRLKPNEAVNHITRYCLAFAAIKHNVAIHSLVVMQNYVRVVITDRSGRLPDFLMDFNRSVAKCLNAAQGRAGSLWAPEHAAVAVLPTAEDVVDEIANTAAIPVTAGLVEHPRHWPGVVLWQPGMSSRVERPAGYFAPNGAAPASVELRIAAPDGVNLPSGAWLARVRAAVDNAVRQARANTVAAGLCVLGAARTIIEAAACATQQPNVEQPSGVLTRFRDLREKLEKAHRKFQQAYRSALNGWRSGNRSEVFPYGTWWMLVHHRAEVVGPPP